MKIQFWTLGKAHESYIAEGVERFTKRIKNYFPVSWQIIHPPKNLSALPEKVYKEKEAEQILSMLKKEDFLILLDETGKMLSSPDLAKLLAQRADTGEKNLVFLIGGAYGVSQEIFERANYCWSLSKLVFPHQLVRLILAEQVYRACSILRNEKYHHE